MMHIILNEPLITDWISSIASLIGVPLVIWGIIKLFIKDKDKEQKIEALTNIAKSQEEITNQLKEQVEQLSKQTNEFEYQSNLMLESNKILEKQIEISYETLTQSREIENKKIEIEKLRRINDIKPYFVSLRSLVSRETAKIIFKNKGNDAHKVNIEPLDKSNVNFQKSNFVVIVEKDKTFEVSVKYKYPRNQLKKDYSFNIIYTDTDQNRLVQFIRVRNGKMLVDKPKLVE